MVKQIKKEEKNIQSFLFLNLIAIVMYFCALFMNLKLSLLVAASLVSVFALFIILNKFDYFKKIHFNLNRNNAKDIFLYALIVIFSFSRVPSDFRFQIWDEFVSWGANIKTIVLDNHLYTIESANHSISGAFYQAYPPVQAIFQFIFINFFGWSEANAIRAYYSLSIIVIYSISQLLAAQLNLRKYALFLIAPILFVYYAMGYSLTNTYGDGLLGLYYAYSLILLHKLQLESKLTNINVKVNASNYLNLISATMVLILVKPTGIILAVTLILQSFVWDLLDNDLKIDLKYQSFLEYFQKFRKTLVLFCVSFLTYLSWQSYLKFQNIDTQILKGDFSKESGITRFFHTIKTFLHKFTESFTVLNFSFSFVWFFAFLICVLILAIKFGNRLQSLTITFTISSFFLYFAFYLFFYNFNMDEYERLNGGSIFRYINSYILGWTIISISIAFQIITQKRKNLRVFFLITASLTAIVIPTQMQVDLIKANQNENLARAINAVTSLTETIDKVKSTNDKVYFIDQGANGYTKNIFVYQNLPNESNWWCWSIGAQKFVGDIWSCNIDIRKILRGYRFLAVLHNDNLRLPLNREKVVSDVILSPGVYKIDSNFPLVLSQISKAPDFVP